MSKVRTLDLELIKELIDIINAEFNGKLWNIETQSYFVCKIKTLAKKTNKELPQRARAWISLLEYFGFVLIKNINGKRLFLTEVGKKILHNTNKQEMSEILKFQLLKWQIYPMKSNFEVKVHPFRAVLKLLNSVTTLDNAELIIIQKVFLNYEDEYKVVQLIQKYRRIFNVLKKSSISDFNQINHRIFIVHHIINSKLSEKELKSKIESQVVQFLNAKIHLKKIKEKNGLEIKSYRDENSILFGKIVNNNYSNTLLNELINIQKMKDLKNSAKERELSNKEIKFMKNYEKKLLDLKSETSFKECDDTFFTLKGYNNYLINYFLLSDLIEKVEEQRDFSKIKLSTDPFKILEIGNILREDYDWNDFEGKKILWLSYYGGFNEESHNINTHGLTSEKKIVKNETLKKQSAILTEINFRKQLDEIIAEEEKISASIKSMKKNKSKI